MICENSFAKSLAAAHHPFSISETPRVTRVVFRLARIENSTGFFSAFLFASRECSTSRATPMTSLRLHVSGWTQSVTEEDIRKRFGLPMVARVTEAVLGKNKFAHVQLELKDIHTSVDEFMTKLKQTYKNAKWKGGLLQFELGLPDYRKRLEAEWEVNAQLKAEANNIPMIGGELNREEENALRIRRRKGEHVTVKKPRLSEFAEEDEEPQQQVDYYCKLMTVIPASQDPSFCCSTGDAGPTLQQPEAVVEQQLAPREPVLPPTALSLFALERLREMKNNKQVKDSKFSLLGKYLKLAAAAV